MELRHLRYFVAVAEERSFTRAARLLHVAQPSLSQQVRELERELGAILLDRSVRPAALTPAGARLLDEARVLLRRLDQAVGAVGRAARGETGELRLGYPTGGLYSTVLEVAREFRRERPDAGLVLLQINGEDQVRAVRERRADIVLSRVGRLPGPGEGVRAARLRTEHLLAVLPADHRLAAGPAVALADLADEPFVMFPAREEPMVAGRYLAACEVAGFSPRVVLEPVDAQSQALAVAAGLGVALTGDGIALRFPDLAYLPVAPPTPVADIAALWPAVDPDPLLAPVLAALGLGPRTDAVLGQQRPPAAGQ